jgi:hypothetical protein
MRYLLAPIRFLRISCRCRHNLEITCAIGVGNDVAPALNTTTTAARKNNQNLAGLRPNNQCPKASDSEQKKYGRDCAPQSTARLFHGDGPEGATQTDGRNPKSELRWRRDRWSSDRSTDCPWRWTRRQTTAGWVPRTPTRPRSTGSQEFGGTLGGHASSCGMQVTSNGPILQRNFSDDTLACQTSCRRRHVWSGHPWYLGPAAPQTQRKPHWAPPDPSVFHQWPNS